MVRRILGIAINIMVVIFMYYTYNERLFFSLSNGICMISIGRELKNL